MNAGLLILVLCTAGPAETLARIDAAREAMAVERVFELRDGLIRDHPDDPRRPVWLADQAQDYFYLLLPTEASGLVTRYGLPTARQRRRAGRVGREMNDLAARAETALEQAVLDAEAGRPGLAVSLLETERNRRVPFLRGIGACLDADFNVEDAGGRRTLYGIARSRLEPVADVLPDRYAATARLYAGLAMLGAGDGDGAARLLRDVSTDPAARRDEVFAARLALVRCGVADLDEIEKAYLDPDDLFFRMLIADERFRRLRPVSPERAFGAYLALGEVAFPRLVRVAGPGTPLDRLPALVAVARAGNLAATPDGRPRAIELYEQLLGSGDLDETAAAAALFGLARAHLDGGDRAAAVRRLARLSGTYPASNRAETSIELAATLAAELNRAAPQDPVYRELLGNVLRLLLDRYPNLPSVDRWRYRAGRLAVDEGRYDDAIGHFDAVAVDAGVRADALDRRADALRAWMTSVRDPATRRRLARRLLDALDDGGSPRPRFRAEALLALDDPAAALAALPPGDAGDEFTLLARIEAYRALGRRDEMAAQLRRLVDLAGSRAGAALAEMIEMRMRDDPESLRPLARAAMRWLDEHGDDDALKLVTADALRIAGEHEDALRLYDELRAEHPDALEVLYGRAECLYHAGTREEEAMDHYRRLVAARAADLDELYWQAQLRMLQILHRRGRNTDRIAPYVRQLRSKDPQLGGERFRREFERLSR